MLGNFRPFHVHEIRKVEFLALFDLVDSLWGYLYMGIMHTCTPWLKNTLILCRENLKTLKSKSISNFKIPIFKCIAVFKQDVPIDDLDNELFPGISILL